MTTDGDPARLTPGPARNPGGRRRTAVAVGVNLVIALVQLSPLGDRLRGRPFVLYHSFFADLVMPFGMYLLLWQAAARSRRFGDWRARALLVFGGASLVEVLQGLGVPLLGRTFDPLDFAMYAGGVLLAVLAERLLLERLFPSQSARPA